MCAQQKDGFFAALSAFTGLFLLFGDVPQKDTDVFGSIRLLAGTVVDGGSFNFVNVGLSFNGSGAFYVPIGLGYSALDPTYYGDIGVVSVVTDGGYAANLGIQAGFGWLVGNGVRLGFRAESQLYFESLMQQGWLGLEAGIQK
jgi:hypothetical protein